MAATMPARHLGGMNFFCLWNDCARGPTPGSPGFAPFRRSGDRASASRSSLRRLGGVEASVPPAVDLQQDRVSWQEIVESATRRNGLSFTSPDHDVLAFAGVAGEAGRRGRAPQRRAPQVAFVPGSGDLPPRNAADIAWSEYNHHWSGLFVGGDRAVGDSEPGRVALGAALAAAVPRAGGVPVRPFRSGNVAARRHRLLLESFPRRRGVWQHPRLRCCCWWCSRCSNGGCARAAGRIVGRRWYSRCSPRWAPLRCC